MFSKLKLSLALALLLTLLTSITVFAKGGFSFIAVTGADLKETVRVTDRELTTDFFTFAYFYEARTEAPSDPGVGYEITRYYGSNSAFDRLHYYPDAGYVFYDGIVNGESEYDGKWYTANPEIKPIFESAMPVQAQPQSARSIARTQGTPVPQYLPVTTMIAVVSGLIVILVLALRVRKLSVQQLVFNFIVSPEVDMFSRTRIALGLVLLASLILTVPVFAGGWAVITLDELPTNVVAGEPLTVGFTVLQHGKTPMDGLEPTITANLYKEQEFVVNAEPDGKPGHYTATLTFPKEGEWRWFINAFSMNQIMPMLNVSAPVGGVANQPVAKVEPVSASISPLLIVRLSALGIGLAGLVFAFQRKSRLAMVVTALCLLVGPGTFVTEPAVSEVEAQSKSSFEEVGSESSISDVELGRQLFIVKGCITCHVDDKAVRRSEYVAILVGPDLTKFSASPDALRIRLKDPSAAKSDTQMPNLNLSEAEIEALIAFINSE